MQPLIAAGLISIGKNIVEAFTQTNTTSAQKNAQPFAKHLENNLNITQPGKPTFHELLETFRNQPEISEFINSGSSTANYFLKVEETGNFTVVAEDGRRLEINHDSTAFKIASDLFSLRKEDSTAINLNSTTKNNIAPSVNSLN